jgi:hypothetical protein
MLPRQASKHPGLPPYFQNAFTQLTPQRSKPHRGQYPMYSYSKQQRLLKSPPTMPPLLRLPTVPQPFSIPASSSGPCKSMIHETPIQTAYGSIPRIASNSSQKPSILSKIVELPPNSKHYIPLTPHSGSSGDHNPCSFSGKTATSYSISLAHPLNNQLPLPLNYLDIPAQQMTNSHVQIIQLVMKT